LKARLDDGNAQRRVLKLLEQSPPSEEERRRWGRVATSGRLLEWKPAAACVLLEVLETMPGGAEVLFELAEDRKEDLAVRIRAMAAIARVRPPDLAARLAKLVSIREEYSVAHSALQVLSLYESFAATAAATEVVGSYRPLLKDAQKAVVGSCIRWLVKAGAMDPGDLVRILEHEIIAADETPPPLKRDPPEDPRAMGRWGGVPMEFRSPTYFVEDLVSQVGRADPPFGREVLRDIVRAPKMRGRGEALIALAGKRDPTDYPLFLEALKDRDGWVRLMAYRALKYVLGKDVCCDWMYGPERERAQAVEEFRKSVEEVSK